MLNLILGGAGSGKTYTLAGRVGAGLAASAREALVLVPEQFTFETERALAGLLPAREMTRVSVVSFTRLCGLVFRELGGYAPRKLDEVGRGIAIALVLHDMRDTLSYYGKQADSPAFQREMATTIGSCKGALASPASLREAAFRLPADGALHAKLTDLANVYEAFDAYVSHTCLDPLDDLSRAAARLEGSDFFARFDLYVDAFKDFNAAQRALLSIALRNCPNVTVALCADALSGEANGLFSPAQTTAERLIRAAHRAECAVGTPTVLTGQPGFLSPALAAFERGLFRPSVTPFTEATDEVAVVTARTHVDEAAEVAADIRRLVRERGYRYREIVVLARGMAHCRDTLREAFARYDIPLFCDERADIMTAPPAVFAASCLAAARRLDTGALLRLGKTGLTRIDDEALAALDNYCYTYDVEGDAWGDDFTGNPDGFSGPMDAEQAARLAGINGTRRALAEPILAFREAAADTDGATVARLLYELLCAYGVPERIEELAAGERETPALEAPPAPGGAAPETGQLTFAAAPPPDDAPPIDTAEDADASGDAAMGVSALPDVWDALMDALDRLADTLAGTQISLERFAKLFATVLGCADYGVIPQTLDAVQLGEVGRARPPMPRAVYIIGVNEGVLPAPVADAGLFTEQEREALAREGVELTGDAMSRLCDERLLAYTACTAASERLTLSYPVGDLAGGQLAPSELIRQALRCFPRLAARRSVRPDDESLAETPRSAFSVYCAGYAHPGTVAASLEPLLREDAARAALLDRLPAVAERPRFSLPTQGPALFRANMRLSPSRVSKYYQCRFSYFCRYGLGCLPRPKAEISPLETGSLVHYVLERIVACNPNKAFCDLTDGELRRAIDTYVDEFVVRVLGGKPAGARAAYLLERLGAMSLLLVRRLAEEFRQSAFTPAATELEIGDEGVAPIVLHTPGGATVRVVGKVDRVDVMEYDGKKYLRVVDYKTGSKDFSLDDVREGIDMQMLLYLFTIWQNGGERFGDVIPAGVLYMPAQASEQNADEKKLRMKGLLLNDPDVLEGMEPGLGGRFIPITMRADGKKALATLEQFGLLRRMIDRRVAQMADGLLAGEIDAVPLNGGSFDLCKTCDYRSVCKREDGETERVPEPFDADRFWAELTEAACAEDLEKLNRKGQNG